MDGIKHNQTIKQQTNKQALLTFVSPLFMHSLRFNAKALAVKGVALIPTATQSFSQNGQN